MKSFSLGRVLGIPFYVHPTFLLWPLWVTYLFWSGGAALVLFGQVIILSVFGCVLLHELGHCRMARLFGIATHDITLYPIGGVARLESTGEGPFEEICIALAGPAVNLAILLLLAPVLGLFFALGWMQVHEELLAGPTTFLGLLGQYLLVMGFANLGLLLLNLLPAFPMDGGRVLRALLSLGMSRLRATEVAAPIGIAIAIGLAIYGLVVGPPTFLLIALFVCFAGQMELNGLRRQEVERSVERQGYRRMTGTEPDELPPVPGMVRPARMGGFTGFIWDRDLGVWTRWENGQPIEE